MAGSADSISIGEHVQPDADAEVRKFAEAARVTIFGPPTETQIKIQKDMSPKVAAEFERVARLLPTDEYVAAGLRLDNLHTEIVLPRFLPEVQDRPFTRFEKEAHERLLAEIRKICMLSLQDLDFALGDPKGIFVQNVALRFLKDMWNPVRATHSMGAQNDPNPYYFTKEFSVEVHQEPLITAGYRAVKAVKIAQGVSELKM